MTSIFNPTGSVLLGSLPEKTTLTNTDFFIGLDSDGFTYKVSLPNVQSFLGRITSLSQLPEIGPNVLLGRYSNGNGPVQEITIGSGFSIDGGVLNAPTVLPSGLAGGDLDGTYPNPTIADGAVTYEKIQDITPNTLLGRYSPGFGSVEEITLSPEFSIVGNQLTLSVGANTIVDTGFLIVETTSDFVAEATRKYICDSSSNITVTVNTMPLGAQFIIVNKGSGNIIINFPNETITLEAEIQRAAYYVSDGTGEYYEI